MTPLFFKYLLKSGSIVLGSICSDLNDLVVLVVGATVGAIVSGVGVGASVGASVGADVGNGVGLAVVTEGAPIWSSVTGATSNVGRVVPCS